jgi:hypothetical protein
MSCSAVSDDVPERAEDDPRQQLLNAYRAEVTAIRNQLEAMCAETGWHLGLLPTDPITGEVPGPAIHTELGLRQVDLQKASCAIYLITEPAALHLIDPVDLEVFADADPGAPSTWCILAHPIDLQPGGTGPWLLGSSLICVPPTTIREGPAPADSLVLMNSNGHETQLETPTGLARWFLVPGYTYLLLRDRSTERWSIREVPNADENWAQLLP